VPSWDEGFADRYDEWSAEMTGDIDFYVDLARAADGPIVELAIGNARVAVPIAQATGRTVTGVDTSPAMLELARAKARSADVQLILRQEDMRDLALDEPAALIYCPYRALLHLQTWADRRRLFERCCQAVGSPGTRSRSITRSHPALTASTRSNPSATRSRTRSDTTGST
jgi:SAM-dependent methyltransferase